MPELPEAEVVRRGLARWATDAVAAELEVLDPRSLRRSPGGA
ncbi:DNA-formamidopyrimidine glycosylase family protein, partial [Micrococcus luteus]